MDDKAEKQSLLLMDPPEPFKNQDNSLILDRFFVSLVDARSRLKLLPLLR
ncbi:hypothetical protein T05_8737 [Trichinella murrelli]|uniref:Uncharacterized protein n=1 Tax=Trichinella murrelli TaxID=144512 RepID=A0A0V0U3F0_9BILA|nr:hypothetical protein T05_8737 [Trichinella murrelli]